MQNKTNHQSEFLPVDKGWELMAQQLDAAMPVEKRRRPIGWWWFLGICLLAVGVIYGGMSTDWWLNAVVTPEEIPVMDAPVDIRPTSRPQAGIEQETAIKQKTTTTRNVELANAQSDDDFMPTSDQIGLAHQPVKTPSKPVEPLVTDTEYIIEPTDAILAVTNEKEERQPERVLEAAVRPLSAGKLTPISAASLMADIAPTLRTTKARQINGFLEAAFMAPIDGEYANSIAIGGGLSKHLGQHWSVEAALLLEKSMANTVEGAFNAVEFADNNNPSGVYVSPGTSSSIASDLSYARVNLDLTARRKFGQRWGISGGLLTTYMAAAYFRTETSTTGSQVVEDTFGTFRGNLNVYGQQDVVFVEELSANNREAIPLNPTRWLFGATAGLHFDLSPRWRLQAKYRRYFNSLDAQNQDLLSRQMISTGIQYRF